jgi:tetratricopeptide (TPR) repeat protein
MTRPRLIILLLILLTLVVYLPVLQYDFINFDDPTYVTENSHVQNGLTGDDLKWAFTTWHGSNWHPITWVSHMLDCELFGVNPAAHHAVNVLLHALNTAVLFLFLQRLLKSLWISAFVAALFAWHPLHIESVAWISERKDVLSTLFALLALNAYTRYVQEKYRPAFWWALLFFALGLLAKPMLVSLPFVLLLLDWWPLGRLPLNRTAGFQTQFAVVTEKWPFFLLAAASCVVTFLAQRAGESVLTLTQLPPAVRVQDALIAYGLYLYKTIWPARLAILYPLPHDQTWIHLALAASSAALILLTLFAWQKRRTAPYLLFGWAWFIGILIPVIGLVKVGLALLADRYTYLPLVGLFLAVALSLRDFARRFPTLTSPILIAALLSLLGCVAVTEHQLPYWRNSETLFQHARNVTRDNATAEINYAAALELRGDLTNALAGYRQAAAIDPQNVAAHNDLGNLLLKLGQPAAALPEFQQAAQAQPRQAQLHNGLGLALTALNQYPAALAQFAWATELDPTYPWSHYESGDVLLKLGRNSEALAQFHEALRLDPDNYQILTHVARVLAASDYPATRDRPTALKLAQKANDLTGGEQPYILDVLAMAEAATGDFAAAQTNAQKALTTATAANLTIAPDLQNRLTLYQHHQPWIESFRATTNNLPATPEVTH